MIPIKQYVSDQLCALINEFPKIQVSCHYDKLDDTFGVKILPDIDFLEDNLLSCKLADILTELLEIYPNEYIGFYTEGSTVYVDKFDYIITGKEFNQNQQTEKAKTVEILNPKFKIRKHQRNYFGRAF